MSSGTSKGRATRRTRRTSSSGRFGRSDRGDRRPPVKAARRQRIRWIRKAIADGRYVTKARLDVAIDRLIAAVCEGREEMGVR